jgi:phosphate starvation-inducible PhoH-like protein
MAGSGKTLLACQIALDMLFNLEIEKIIITRPTVAKEDIGFLPGDLKDKMDPWLAPIYSNLNLLYNKYKIEKLLQEDIIEIVPFAFMRGRTFPNAMVIVDECQNITHSQTEMILGRLGKGGKMVFCGDLAQVDLKTKKDSGIGFFTRLEENIKGVRIISLKYNHRHEIVEPILKLYSEYRD